MLRTVLVAVAMVGATSIPVLAADPIRTAPAPLPSIIYPTSVTHDWTGFYVGATVGYAHVSTSAARPNESAWGGSLHAGYLHDFGDWVVGVQGDFVPSAFSHLTSGNRSLGNAGRIVATAGAKLGAGGNTLVYGLAGAGVAQNSNAGTNYTDWGWTVGAGVRHAFSDNWSVNGEVSYAHFDHVGGTNNRVEGFGVGLGISYHF